MLDIQEDFSEKKEILEMKSSRTQIKKLEKA
jgi:hypothetical protein